MASGFRARGAGGGGGGGVLAGDVSGPLLANVINPNVVTGGAGGMLQNQTVTQSNLDPNALPNNNMLTNPDFNICQLYDPTAATTIADNAISADAWKLTRENAGTSYQRISNALSAGYNSAFSGRFTKTVAAGKLMAYQPLEMIITQKCAGRAIVFTVHLNLSAARGMRIGFLSHAGATPNEVVPAPIAAWNGAGVYPTLNAGFSDLGNFQFAAPVGQSTWSVAFNMPVFSVNDVLSVIVLADDPFAAGDFFDLYETVLDIGDQGRPFSRALSEAEDIERCQRFIEKSYDLDTVPGTVTDNGTYDSTSLGTSISLSPVDYRPKVRLPSALEISFFSPVSGTIGNLYDTFSASDVPITSTRIGQSKVTPNTDAGHRGDEIYGHYLVNTSL